MSTYKEVRWLYEKKGNQGKEIIRTGREGRILLIKEDIIYRTQTSNGDIRGRGGRDIMME